MRAVLEGFLPEGDRVCLCVSERECGRERECVCERERMCEREYVCAVLEGLSSEVERVCERACVRESV